ncbi:hypothetical protein [Nocardioides taihuensis]|uniref:Lipoprotein n=1 Tax=Nocardioides taihuensis TaxID=1835606 RepID=A0ABW0BE81_9ACTN
MKQALLTLAVLAVISVTSVACNAGRPPTDASPDTFCAQVHDFYSGVDRLGGGASNHEVAGLVKQLARRLADVGTPGDIPTDARQGFELTLDAIHDLPDDASTAEVEAIDADLSLDERRDTQAFDTYLALTCGTSTDAVGGPV